MPPIVYGNLRENSTKAFMIICKYHSDGVAGHLRLSTFNGLQLSYNAITESILNYVLPLFNEYFLDEIDALLLQESIEFLGSVNTYNIRGVNYLTLSECVRFLNQYLSMVQNFLSVYGNIQVYNIFNDRFNLNNTQITQFFNEHYNGGIPQPEVEAIPHHPGAAAVNLQHPGTTADIPEDLIYPNSNYTNNKLKKYKFLKHKYQPGNVQPSYKILPYSNKDSNVLLTDKGKDILMGEAEQNTLISDFLEENKDDAVIIKVIDIRMNIDIYLWPKSVLLEKLNPSIVYPCRVADADRFGRESNIRLDITLYSLQQIIGRRINVLKSELDSILNKPGNSVISLYKTDHTFPSVASINIVLGRYKSVVGKLHCSKSEPEELWTPEEGAVLEPSKKRKNFGPHRTRKNSFNTNNNGEYKNSPNSNTEYSKISTKDLRRKFKRMTLKNNNNSNSNNEL
jgi:hypothetical protein